MKKTLLSVLTAVVIFGTGAFYGGMRYTENKALSDRQQRIQQFGANAGAGGARFRQGFGGQEFTTGEIISKDANSVTVKLQDGGSKIIFLSDSTEISKFAEGNLSDLEIGKNVSINGVANSDGSVTAQIIQLRPARNQ